MMKRLSLYIAFCAAAMLVACEQSNKIEEGTKQTEMTEEIVIKTESENKTSEPVSEAIESTVQEEPELEYANINFSEMISLDFVEITIEGANFGDEVIPENPSDYCYYLPDIEGEKYIYVFGTIKNISGNSYEFADNMFAKIIFDNKYNYNARIRADENGSLSFIYAFLNPLKSEKFYICASVPDELIDTYSQMVVHFGFKENFDYGKYGIVEFECDYLYSITVTN